jgi:hypothetical protein
VLRRWWSKRSRGQRRLLFAGVLSLGTGILGCLVGELYVRVRHPAYGDLWGAIRSHPTWVRELQPGAQGRMRGLSGEYDHAYAINGQGLREVADLGPKQAGRPRVLCVGDSNTFGLGVEDDEVWVRYLAQAGLEPVNAGWASGYAPDTASLYLEGRGVPELEPDVVLAQLTPGNDLTDMGTKSVWQRDEAGRLESIEHGYGWVPDWVQALALPRYLALQVAPGVRRWWRGPSQTHGKPHDQLVAWRRVRPGEAAGLERLTEVLARQRDFLAERGVRFVVLLLPCPSQHLPDLGPATREHFGVLRVEVASAARQLDIPTLDPEGSPEWLTALASGEPLFYRDWHLTAAGNAAVGRYTARALSELLAAGD